MVMAALTGFTKIATWEELLRSDTVVNGSTMQPRTTYAIVHKGERGGIRRPLAFAGVQLLDGPMPYSRTLGEADIADGTSVVMVRLCVKGMWTRKLIYRAALLALVAPDQVSADIAVQACLPPINLGKLRYE